MDIDDRWNVRRVPIKLHSINRNYEHEPAGLKLGIARIILLSPLGILSVVHSSGFATDCIKVNTILISVHRSDLSPDTHVSSSE